MPAATYRRPGSEERRVRNLLCERLPPEIRSRLARSLAGVGAPEPLLVDAPGRKLPFARVLQLLVVAAIVAEIAICLEGFGEARSPHALQPLAFAGAHVGATFTLLFTLIYASRFARTRISRRARDGRYLFALDLVEIDGRFVRLTELHTLRRVEARAGKRGSSIVLAFADAHEITFERQPDAASLAASVKAAVDAAVALSFTDDQPRLARLDPFFDLRVTDDWASAEVDAKDQRSLLLRAPLRALIPAIFVASTLAGFGLYALRNRLSDDEMYARASTWNHGSIGRYTGVRHAAKIDALRFERARGDAQGLRHYLAEGGAHRIEADAELWRVLARDPDQRRTGLWLGGMGFAAATSRIDELRTGDIAALDDSLKVSAVNSAKVDDELFFLTRISGFAKSYRFYLAHGFIHAIEVRRTLLPEAAYYEAKGSDDVIELGNFVTEFPDSPHAAEIAALVRSKIADRERGR